MHQHTFTPSEHEGYEVCDCGTYHSTQLLSREAIYENNYWNGDTRSLLKDQVLNLTETESCGISKVDKVLQYVSAPGRVLEIGCAPGEMMRRMTEQGNYAVGIEPDIENIPGIQVNAGNTSHIIHGYFPECMGVRRGSSFDYIIGMDILEHVEDYKAFLQGVRYFLREGGTAIFMSPILFEDGFYRKKDFKSDEHAWLFSRDYLRRYVSSLFKTVEFDRWTVGHEMVIVGL